MCDAFPVVKVYAVDVKEEQIDDCTRFFHLAGVRNASFAVEDLTHIEHENRFDLAVSVDVMEHIPDNVGVFRIFTGACAPAAHCWSTPFGPRRSDAHGPEDESFIGEHARNGYGV